MLTWWDESFSFNWAPLRFGMIWWNDADWKREMKRCEFDHVFEFLQMRIEYSLYTEKCILPVMSFCVCKQNFQHFLRVNAIVQNERQKESVCQKKWSTEWRERQLLRLNFSLFIYDRLLFMSHVEGTLINSKYFSCCHHKELINGKSGCCNTFRICLLQCNALLHSQHEKTTLFCRVEWEKKNWMTHTFNRLWSTRPPMMYTFCESSVWISLGLSEVRYTNSSLGNSWR